VLEAVGIRAEHGDRVVVHDGSLAIHPGECLAMVGESGSGKTTFARCLVGLHVPAAGAIRLDARELSAAATRRSRADRAAIQVVFQNPNLALNPRITVADAIGRPLRLLHGEGAAETERQVADLLEQVRLPQRLADRLPFELSGGERQRAAIACALAARPRILVCDEVTSSLDVSVQAVVIDLLAELRSTLDLSMLFVTHDLGVVRALADRVVVLKDGGIREEGPVRRVLYDPADDYTRLLVDATPRLRTETS
jgi:peptide/nickel transport system ATP-binding protein